MPSRLAFKKGCHIDGWITNRYDGVITSRIITPTQLAYSELGHMCSHEGRTAALLVVIGGDQP